MITDSGKSATGDWLAKLNPLYWLDLNWQEVRNAYGCFLDNPSQGILHILAAGSGSRWQTWVEARLATQAQALRGVMVTVDLSALQQLPANTLGGAYARHMVNQGFDPAAFVTPESQNDWLKHRMSLSHDVHHIMTGFDGTPVGEFGLAVFVLVQYHDLLNVFVLSHLPWFLIGHPYLLLKTLAAVVKGFWLGVKSRPVIAYPFEQNWHKSLTQVRRELRLA